MRLSEINTAGIKNGDRIPSSQFRELMKGAGAGVAGNEVNAKTSKGKSQKVGISNSKPSKKKSNKRQDSGVTLPWYTLYLKERCRLEADIELLQSDREYYYQVCVMLFVAETYPNLKRKVHASPNGGNRNLHEAKRLKRAGALKGVPDIQFMVARSGYHGLYIEMKKLPRDYGKDPEIALREVHLDQHYVRVALLEENYLSVVCYGVEEAISVIKAYMNGTELPLHILKRWDNWDWERLAKRDKHQKAA